MGLHGIFEQRDVNVIKHFNDGVRVADGIARPDINGRYVRSEQITAAEEDLTLERGRVRESLVRDWKHVTRAEIDERGLLGSGRFVQVRGARSDTRPINRSACKNERS